MSLVRRTGFGLSGGRYPLKGKFERNLFIQRRLSLKCPLLFKAESAGKVFHSGGLEANYPLSKELAAIRCQAAATFGIWFCLYFYCSEWAGVTMPGFENINRQCL